ncbi:hypothetical protein V8D89_002697 [Ganoderma adspersum]
MPQNTPVAHSSPQLPIEVWQLVMDTVWDATTYTTFYTNQADYRAWALVSHAWRTCAQAVLFRTVELSDPALLHRFAALLNAAPHLAAYVRTLRPYSRDLHTRDNVVALLPAVLSLERAGGGGLPNLRTLLLTRITEQDTWHPHAARVPSVRELGYMPLDLSPDAERYGHGCPDFRQGLELHFAGVSELYLSYVTFETFGALVQVLHGLRNLRLLSCLEIRWCELGPVPQCLAWKGEGKGEGKEKAQGRSLQAFLPKLEDLTIAYMDLYGVERLLAALSHSAALKVLYIDCPHYNPMSIRDPPPVDPVTGTPLGIDLRAFSRLGSLWLALPYTRGLCKDLPGLVAALLWTWTPAGDCAARQLTLTPSYESVFTRTNFADVLRALGPVIEDVLLGERSVHPQREEEKAGPIISKGQRGVPMSVEVCVVDKVDKHKWWRKEARASFERLSAQGRLAVSFDKSFWPKAQWLDDSNEHEAPSAVQDPLDAGTAQVHVNGERVASVDGVHEGGRASDGAARRRRPFSWFICLRPVSLKRVFHVAQGRILKLKPACMFRKKRRPGTGTLEVFVGT